MGGICQRHQRLHRGGGVQCPVKDWRKKGEREYLSV